MSHNSHNSHAITTESVWTFQTWAEGQINLKTNDLIKEIDNLNQDLKRTPKNVKNLITQQGLEELAKSRVPTATKTTNSHHAIGTGTTRETQADTALGSEVLRKAITTSFRIRQY